MGLAEPDEKAVEVQPLLIGGFPNHRPEMGRVGTFGVQISVPVTNRDLTEICVVGRDGSDCHCNPTWIPWAHEGHVFEFCRPR